jgi:hypothetical protein
MTVELVHSAACPLVGVPVLETLPPPPGDAHVPSPRQNVELDALVPLLRLATGRLPVTPVLRGRPVAFVSTPDAGVPSAGVVNVGAVRVRPAMVVVVLLAATEVEPMVMGKPDVPPQGEPLSTMSIPLAANLGQLLAVPAVAMPTAFTAPALLLFITQR